MCFYVVIVCNSPRLSSLKVFESIFVNILSLFCKENQQIDASLCYERREVSSNFISQVILGGCFLHYMSLGSHLELHFVVWLPTEKSSLAHADLLKTHLMRCFCSIFDFIKVALSQCLREYNCINSRTHTSRHLHNFCSNFIEFLIAKLQFLFQR